MKRKAISSTGIVAEKEDDEEFIVDLNEQAAFQTKCSPSRLKGICDKLTERQREVLVEIGFGSLLEFRCTQLDRVLCKELVDCFDVQQYVMHIRGCRISVAAEDVGLIFGIPSSEGSSEVSAEVEDVKGRSNKELEGIIGQGNTDNTFRKTFLLCVINFTLPGHEGDSKSKVVSGRVKPFGC